jgi:hypothetical protein
VEFNLKQPVSAGLVTPVDNFPMEKVFGPEEMGSGKNLKSVKSGQDDFHVYSIYLCHIESGSPIDVIFDIIL